jgi:tetratricopeptide (TPR) repeat protein
MSIHPSVYLLSRRLWIVPAVTGAVAAVLFCMSLPEETWPGYPASLTAAAAGLAPPSQAAHPLFAWLARGLAALDAAALPVRLQLFGALCGTLSVMLTGWLAGRAILFCACDDAGGGGRADAPEWEDGEDDRAYAGDGLPPEVEAHNRRMLRVAAAGGMAAAFLLMFSAPVFAAATRLDNSVWTLALALSSLALFPAAPGVPACAVRLALSFFFFALGCFESAVFLLLLPCYLFFLFRVLAFAPGRASALCGLAAAGAAAVALAVCLFRLNGGDTAPQAPLAFAVDYARQLAYGHYHELSRFFPRRGWLLVALQAGVPAFLLLFGLPLLFKERRVSALAALFLLAAFAAPALLGGPFSAPELLRAAGRQPAALCALLAAAAGVALAAALNMAWRAKEVEADDVADEVDAADAGRLPGWTRVAAGMVFVALCVAVAVLPWLTLRRADSGGGAFADRIAREMLEVMGERTCLISNGTLDRHLLIQAAMLKRPLTLITLRGRPVPAETEALARLIDESPLFADKNRRRLKNALSLGTVSFVLEWFRAEPDAGCLAMVFAAPEIWTACGYRAVPEGLAFGGARAAEAPASDALLRKNVAFQERVAPLLASRPGEGADLAALRGFLRMRAGFAANELGILLEDAERFDSAYQAYECATEIDPMNFSAAANGYAVAHAQNLHPERHDRLKARMRAVWEGYPPGRRNLAAVMQNFGSIRQAEFYRQQTRGWSSIGARAVATDRIRKVQALSGLSGASALLGDAAAYLQMRDTAKAEAAYLAALELDPASRDALVGLCTLTLGAGRVPEAEAWLSRARAAGTARETLLYQEAVLAIVKKEHEKALNLLAEATKKHPEDLRYRALQADLLLEQGDIKWVEHTVLPGIQKALKGREHALIHAIRGAMLKKKGTRFYSEARQAMLAALALNADQPDIWKVLFELDLAIGNPEFTETDARNRLRITADDAIANYLLGSLLLARSELESAEDFLRRSIESRPTAAACNDLAENLRLLKRLPDAEVFARKALELQPGLSPALDTLACVLCDVGRYGEAAQAAGQAVAARPDHAPYQLTLLRAQVGLGDREGVRQRLEWLARAGREIPEALRKEIEAMP